MKSHASDTTLVGAGSRAPGSEQRSCQTNSVTERTMSGGTTTLATCRAASAKRSTAGRTGGRKVTISAVVPGTGTAAATDVGTMAARIALPSWVAARRGD